jgi:hypothetical protein
MQFEGTIHSILSVVRKHILSFVMLTGATV